MSEVVKFYPADAAKSADNVLEQAIGDYSEVLILGFDDDGNLEARATTGLKQKDVLWMIEAFKFGIMDGAYGDDGDY